MEKTEQPKNRYGLVGRDIAYSFSQGYFTQKFKDLKLYNHSYENFDIQDITAFEEIVSQPYLKGLNVTIPYKEQIIPYLDTLDATAEAIGAVNTIKITKEGLKGYNTDAYGFRESIVPLLQPHHTQALILGTGGASKAVRFVLDTLAIPYTYVSRSKREGQYTYQELDKAIIESHAVIVNCTPVGTYPNVTKKPSLPYQHISKRHLLYDLIYNPKETAFLGAGVQNGATICNGLKMLQKQAEKAWAIWNKSRFKQNTM